MRKISTVSWRAALMATALCAAACNTGKAPAEAEKPAAASKPATPATQAAAPATQAAAPAAPAGDATKALFNPSLAAEKSPDTFSVKLETTKGDVVIDVTRAWSPNGADRIYNLVKSGYYDDIAFFRVVPGFMAQVGINGNPAANTAWRSATIQDDPVTQSNKRGYVTFAKTGMPNSRSTQIFINFSDNDRLDGMGFAPFGQVKDMAIVDKLNGEYGDGAPSGRGPNQMRVQSEGNGYLKAEFPNLDYIKKATIL
jgi:peptidyl-prolyl cis-trans isomerase A (cyclophilin A)